MSNCAHAQKVWDIFEMKDPGECHDLYITLLLADVFENVRDKCTEIHQLDPVYLVFAPGLA